TQVRDTKRGHFPPQEARAAEVSRFFAPRSALTRDIENDPQKTTAATVSAFADDLRSSQKGQIRMGEAGTGALYYAGSPVSNDVNLTTLLASAELGDRVMADKLFTELYGELHRMARRELSRRGGIVTLSATTLLHCAYLDISGREGAEFPDRNHFMAYAA